MNEQIKAIRNEIKRLEEIHERNLKKPMERGRIGFAHGVVECCDRILSFIDSLPEEKPSEDLEEAAEESMPEAEGFLEIDIYGGSEAVYSREQMLAMYKAGAEWQKEQMMNEWLQDRDGCFWDGVEEGKKAMEEQGQTKEGEVIEDGEFIKFSDGTYIDLCPDLSKESFAFKTGEKVIVQIRKA